MNVQTNNITNKLAEDRIQFVFAGEPVVDSVPATMNYGSEEAIGVQYQVDVDGLKRKISSLGVGFEVNIGEASIGLGAPIEGWLIDVYRMVTPIVVEIAAYLVVGKQVYKILKGITKHLDGKSKLKRLQVWASTLASRRKSGLRLQPMLSAQAIKALSIWRYTRFRRKGRYFVEGMMMFQGQECLVYEPWDIYMIRLGIHNSRKVIVLFVDSYGCIKGKTSLKVDRKYVGGSPYYATPI